MEALSQKPYYTFRVSIRKNEQETIIDTAVSGCTPEEVAEAKATVKSLLDSYAPAFPAPAPAMEPQADPDGGKEPDPAPAPATGRKNPRGAMFLKCPSCGRTFGTFLREAADSVDCRCGYQIPTAGSGVLAHYNYTCPCCETMKYGWTNLQDAEIEMKCRCGNTVTLVWDAKAREYL